MRKHKPITTSCALRILTAALIFILFVGASSAFAAIMAPSAARPSPKATSPIAASTVTHLPAQLSLVGGTSSSYTISVKNEGWEYWYQQTLKLLVTTTDGTPSGLADNTWPTPIIAAVPNEQLIAPGDIATFPLTILAPTRVATVPLTLSLRIGSNIDVPGSTVSGVVAINYSPSTIFSKFYPAPAATWKPNSINSDPNFGSYSGFTGTPYESDVVPVPINLTGGNEPTLRVGLYEAQGTIIVVPNAPATMTDMNGNTLATIGAKTPVMLSVNLAKRIIGYSIDGTPGATTQGVRFLAATSTPVIWSIPTLDWHPAGSASIHDNRFRGALELRISANAKSSWVINELRLEDYLKGMAETSNSSPFEFQKTLTTAARTYALYHYLRKTKHANEHFDVDATYDQVYRGYNAELRTPNLSQAVDATRGRIVTYNNQLVITPYFSHSDGRTRSWEEVWAGGPKAWLKSVPVPSDAKYPTLSGHGVGLSAQGAVYMAAAQGKNYLDILHYFYTGVLVRIAYS